MNQYGFALVMGVIMTVLTVLGMVDTKTDSKASQIVGVLVIGTIIIMWLYMCWWGIFLN